MKTKQTLDHYAVFAELFRYPTQRLETSTLSLVDLLITAAPEFSRNVLQVVKRQREMSLGAQQEYYLKTFDVQAVCTLDVGYLLFGEDYKRAQLLVNLQKEMSDAGVDCKGELADHLPNLLELLVKTGDEELARELGFLILLPAVKFMLVRMKNIKNYYRTFLVVLRYFLEKDFVDEHLKEFEVPESLFTARNEFLFPSPQTLLCDFGTKPKRFDHVE